MKIIELTQGERALISDEDYDAVMEHKWHYQHNCKTGHVIRKMKVGGKWTAQQLHAFITERMGIWVPGCQIDHGGVSNCSLDNRRENLRVVTNQQNGFNRSFRSDNASGIPGVCWHKKYGKWLAHIKVNGRRKHLGYFDNLQDAAFARWNAEKEFFGEYRYRPYRVCPLAYTDAGCECIRKVIEETFMLEIWRDYEYASTTEPLQAPFSVT